jgi:hypothetical protein
MLREQLLIAEAAISKNCDAAASGHEFGEPAQTRILKIITPILDLILPDAEPKQRCRTAMAGDQMQGECRLVVVVEIGPVHGNKNLAALTDLMRHPAGKTIPHVDAVVAEHPINLLDGVLGDQTLRQGQRLADHRDRERGRLHDAERGRRQLGQSAWRAGPDHKPRPRTRGRPRTVPAADPDLPSSRSN